MVRCNVKGCERNPEKDKQHSFFLWPKDDLIRQQWKEFAQYEGPSKNLRICSDHFEMQYLRKNTPPKRLLVPKAVPTILPASRIMEMPKAMPAVPPTSKTTEIPFVDANDQKIIIFQRPALKDEREVEESKESQESKILEAKISSNIIQPILQVDATSVSAASENFSSTNNEGTLSPKILSDTSLQCSTLKRNQKSIRKFTLSRTIARLRSQIHSLRRKKKFAEKTKQIQDVESIINASSQNLGKQAQIIFASQMRLSIRKKYANRYNDDVKDIALSIKYHSPKAYKLLGKIMHLPSIRTLNEYQKKILRFKFNNIE